MTGSAAGVLARAFADDPLFAWALPDPARRTRALPYVFAGTLRHCRRRGGEETAGDVDAVVGWMRGEHLRMSPRDVLAAGLVTTPARLGLAATRRLQAHEAACERALVEAAPPRWAYLCVVGVEPTAQGRGLGRAVISASLDAMSSDHATCLLKTENPRNVAVYEHLGFRVVRTVQPPVGPESTLLRHDL
jgi:ribosomal protein S18 acetylase RimI-like enzyme